LDQLKKELDSKIIILEPFVLPVSEDRVQWREDLDQKIQVVRKLAREYSAFLIPLDGVMAQACTRREPEFWAADGVHPMVRLEFAYVAENLLLRGGYRKTHFQADQTTLQSVSQIGEVYNKPIETLTISNYKTFTPSIVWDRKLESSTETFYFQESILQSLIRQHLSVNNNLKNFLFSAGLISFKAEDFEVLGEKALSEGYIDILIKDRMPVGYSMKIILEIKTGNAKYKDIEQVQNYIREMGPECIAGVLIAQKFSKKLKEECESIGIKPFIYTFGQIEKSRKYTLEDLKRKLQIFKVDP